MVEKICVYKFIPAVAGIFVGGSYLTYFIVIPRKRGISSLQLKPQDPGVRRCDASLQPRRDPALQRDDVTNTYYFFTAQNRARSHPMPVHPNTHDAMRMRMATAFGFSDLAARYAGASMIAHSASPATIYLIIKMCSAFSDIFYFPYVALLPSSSSIRNN